MKPTDFVDEVLEVLRNAHRGKTGVIDEPHAISAAQILERVPSRKTIIRHCGGIGGLHSGLTYSAMQFVSDAAQVLANPNRSGGPAVEITYHDCQGERFIVRDENDVERLIEPGYPTQARYRVR